MYSCNLCELGFKSANGRSWHFRSVHLKIRYPCRICGLQFTQKNNLENHLRLHLNERPFKCEQCPKSFVSKKDLSRHIKVHDESFKNHFKCEICTKTFSNSTDLKRHIKMHSGKHRIHKCDICGHISGCVSHLKRHSLIHSNEKIHPCPHDGCNMKFRTSEGSKRHSVIHQRTRQQYKCQQCGSLLAYKESLRAHMNRLHNANRSGIACVFCTKTCKTNGDLNKHILSHIKEKPYSCELCNKEFVDMCNVNQHIRRRHTAERPFSCDHCEYRSVTSTELMGHMRTHAMKASFEVCDVCGKLIRDEQGLKAHKKKVHSSPERRNRHKCEQCNKWFSTTAELNKHKRKHKNESKQLK